MDRVLRACLPTFFGLCRPPRRTSLLREGCPDGPRVLLADNGESLEYLRMTQSV